MNQNKNITDLAEAIHRHNCLKGFYDDVANANEQVKNLFISQQIALIHSEVSEAMEYHRKPKPDNHLPHRTGFEVELADAIIRILDLCGYLQIDINTVIFEKLEYNTKRPYKHGKQF